MGLTKSLKIHKECTHLLEIVDRTYEQMKHHHKINLGRELFDNTLTALKNINMANHATELNDRIKYINNLLENIEFIDTLANYCSDRMVMPLRNAASIVASIDAIKDQAIAWKNYTQKQLINKNEK